MKIFTWKQRLIVYTTTLGAIGLFLLIGAFIDKLLDSHPIALYISLAASYPVSQLMLMKRLRKQSPQE